MGLDITFYKMKKDVLKAYQEKFGDDLSKMEWPDYDVLEEKYQMDYFCGRHWLNRVLYDAPDYHPGDSTVLTPACLKFLKESAAACIENAHALGDNALSISVDKAKRLIAEAEENGEENIIIDIEGIDWDYEDSTDICQARQVLEMLSEDIPEDECVFMIYSY